jgi:hypothetical protein
MKQHVTSTMSASASRRHDDPQRAMLLVDSAIGHLLAGNAVRELNGPAVFNRSLLFAGSERVLANGPAAMHSFKAASE